MAVIALQQACLTVANKDLLDHVDLTIESGERIGLLGRNGAGKSTFLKIIQQQVMLDSGRLIMSPSTVVASLTQQVPQYPGKTIYAVIAEALREIAELLMSYHDISREVALEATPERLERLHHIQGAIEQKYVWQQQLQIDAIISRFELDPDELFENLSGGMKRRVLLAQALVVEPDVLLLDEPTNHLDVTAIEWLEQFLQSYSGTLICITHDRRFLQAIATRIIELDRGKFLSCPGDYLKFLAYKQHVDETAEQHNKLFDKKLAQEEVWIRQGVKARRTRNEGRVRNLEKLRQQYAERKQQVGKAKISVSQAESSGKIVVEANNVSYAINNKSLFQDFSVTIMRGDKIGVIGPNGCGKTTLLKCLLGEIALPEAMLKIGTKLEVAYFDQMREQLDDKKSIQDNVGQGSDRVTVNGASKHIIGYLQDFLFTPEQARGPIRMLSGGERNRVLLAKLFTKPANVFVLDEPTNDLDIETLELLEDILVEFTGTVIVVSHDREFLNNVVTSTIGYIAPGRFETFVGGYDDYLRQRPRPSMPQKAVVVPAVTAPRVTERKSVGLSYQEQKELTSLPNKIANLEAKQQTLMTAMADPAFYQRSATDIARDNKSLHEVQTQLDALYKRWTELEEKAS